MENTPQVNNIPTQRVTLTSSKVLDVIIGVLLGIGILFSPQFFWEDSFILSGTFAIIALILAKVSGFKYLFYGILALASTVGIVFGGCMFLFSLF